MGDYLLSSEIMPTEVANTDLSNLSNTGESHFTNPALTNSSYTTNRILEIPQNIKLELNNGTLTLKAGSKVYVPNGFESDGTTPKFDVVTIDSDITYSISGGSTVTGTSLFFLYSNNTIGSFTGPDDAKTAYYFSGSTAPTVTLTYALWYDTTNNLIKHTYNKGSTWIAGSSLPLGVFSYVKGSGLKSIDQIFNGFGYIGSTVFVLPGVKVQIPDGRNADGTCNYLLKETTSVIRTSVSGSGLNRYMMIDSNGNIAGPTNQVKYDSELNSYIYTHDNSKQSWCIFAGLNFESDKITSWKPYSVDSVANSNASNFSQAGRSYLSGLGMPDVDKAQLVSNSFASGTNFTAPTSGWFCCRAISTTTSGNMMLFMCAVNSSNQVAPPYNGGTFPATSTTTARQVVIPAEAGQKIQVQYSNASLSGDVYCGLWFIPAKGEN